MKKILICRTDAIGDVILTLPLTGILKEKYPQSTIYFLGKSYTKAVIESCSNVDHFLNWDEIKANPKKIEALNIDVALLVFPSKEIAQTLANAKIPVRIGTKSRWYNWFYCTKLVSLPRKKSDLHEAQLNIKLAQKHFKLADSYPIEILPSYYNWKKTSPTENFLSLLSPKFNLVIHSKSKGSAKEWKLTHYKELVSLLPENQFQVYISGTADEGKLIHTECSSIFDFKHVTDITGKMSLPEFIAFIGSADGLLACSTGPLHIASAQGINALGIYPNNRPMHPGRWKPIGDKANYICYPEANGSDAKEDCMNKITPQEVFEKISKWKKFS